MAGRISAQPAQREVDRRSLRAQMSRVPQLAFEEGGQCRARAKLGRMRPDSPSGMAEGTLPKLPGTVRFLASIRRALDRPTSYWDLLAPVAALKCDLPE